MFQKCQLRGRTFERFSKKGEGYRDTHKDREREREREQQDILSLWLLAADVDLDFCVIQGSVVVVPPGLNLIIKINTRGVMSSGLM